MSRPLLRAYSGPLPKARSDTHATNTHFVEYVPTVQNLGQDSANDGPRKRRAGNNCAQITKSIDQNHLPSALRCDANVTCTPHTSDMECDSSEADSTDIDDRNHVSSAEDSDDSDDDVDISADIETTYTPSSTEVDQEYDDFGYGMQPDVSAGALLQIILYKVQSRGNVSHRVHADYCNVIAHFSTEAIKADRRTVESNLERLTGVRQTRFDACESGCVAYTGINANATTCWINKCKKPRWQGADKRPTFDYISVIHRLKLWYSSPNRAMELKNYVAALKMSAKTGVKRDVWEGKLMTLLRGKGLFVSIFLLFKENFIDFCQANDTDLAFAFSTDGVNLFKKGKQLSVWPLMLTCLNLSPEIRFLPDNILYLGMAPGPSKPGDIDSFLRPMIDEFKKLQAGIHGVLDASTNTLFTLKAHIIIVTGDMPAKDDLMGLKGCNSTYPCNYCEIKSTSKRYAVLTPPQGPDHDQSNCYYVTPLLRQSRHISSQARALPIRTHQQMKAQGLSAQMNGEAIAGVKRLSIFHELDSIVFPW